MLHDVDVGHAQLVAFLEVASCDEMKLSSAGAEGRTCRGCAGVREVGGKSVEGATNLAIGAIGCTCFFNFLWPRAGLGLRWKEGENST